AGRGAAYPSRPPVGQRLGPGARGPARRPPHQIRGGHRDRRRVEHDLPRAGIRDGESLGQRSALHLGHRESQGHPRARAARGAAPGCDDRRERPRGGRQAVRHELEGNRRAELEDRQLRQEARVTRYRGARAGGPRRTERSAAGGRARGRDLETEPGMDAWRVGVVEPGRGPRSAQGSMKIARRDFHVERLTLPGTMVDLDPETERRAVTESKQLATLYRTITPERLWRGKFTNPVGTTGTGSGFGARRIINGQPRSPHSGSDYSAPKGTPVVAVNAGKVALVAEFFFPGRLVILDHGLGLYTAYFHLDSTAVAEGERVDRGQTP